MPETTTRRAIAIAPGDLTSENARQLVMMVHIKQDVDIYILPDHVTAMHVSPLGRMACCLRCKANDSTDERSTMLPTVDLEVLRASDVPNDIKLVSINNLIFEGLRSALEAL